MNNLLQHFQTISLKDMNNVRLMNRIDTKFVTTTDKLNDILDCMKDGYFLQQGNMQQRVAQYNTTYLDTCNNDMYLQHHNGKCNRYKVRIRQYTDDMKCFLELKCKNNKGKTNKVRTPITHYHFCTSDLTCLQFLNKHNLPFQHSQLTPTVETVYQRITLVNHHMAERVTVDINLTVNNLRNGYSLKLPQLVIVEVKQSTQMGQDKLMHKILKQLNVKPNSFSKYCIGTALTSNAKQNNFKNKIRLINKLVN